MRYSVCATNKRIGDLLAARATVQPVGEYDRLQDAFLVGAEEAKANHVCFVWDNVAQRKIPIPARLRV
jgi:hypothetical protein